MGTERVMVGNVEITSISDGTLEFDLCNFYLSIATDDWSPYEDHLTQERRVRFNLGSFLVRSNGRTVLVDTGLGPKPAFARETGWGELLDQLRDRDVPLEEIDMVVMTHLQRDHVGRNLLDMEGSYQPTFPRARYWISAADWEFFCRPENLELHPTTRGCVLPLQQLGILELMEGEHALTSEMTTLPPPGHTPGHMSIVISSQGERCLILGDAAHSPVQVQETDWCSRVDVDPDHQTRADGAIGAGGHASRLGALSGPRLRQCGEAGRAPRLAAPVVIFPRRRSDHASL